MMLLWDSVCLLEKQGSGGALTVNRSIFIVLRQSHYVDICNVVALAAPLKEASVCVCLGCQYVNHSPAV